MSTLDIEAIKARLAAATPGPWDIGTATDCSGDTAILAEIRGETTVIAECFAELVGKDGVVAKNSQRCLATATLIAHAPTDIAALLAEVERLQRERSEWCDRADVLMTEHMTQLRDLLAEVAALRERLTLTEDVLVKAQAAFMGASAFCDWQEGVRAALLAAGMEEVK